MKGVEKEALETDSVAEMGVTHNGKIQRPKAS
jgi:hypothetical protein